MVVDGLSIISSTRTQNKSSYSKKQWNAPLSFLGSVNGTKQARCNRGSVRHFWGGKSHNPTEGTQLRSFQLCATHSRRTSHVHVDSSTNTVMESRQPSAAKGTGGKNGH
jgi:hypothetical protein